MLAGVHTIAGESMMNTPSTPAELDKLIAAPDAATCESLRERAGGFAVLGAGGKMGFHLCLMLRCALAKVNRSETVYAVSRFQSVRARNEFEAIGCSVIAADLSDPEQLAALPDVRNVFYLAGVKFGTSHNADLLQQMNVTMPQLVAERFRDSEIVALSTGCVYSFASAESGGSTEDSETNPPGDYAQSCLGREAAFFDAAANFRTKSALIRLNYSIDLRYGVLVDLVQKILRDEPVDLTTGYVNVIWQGDAIRYTIRSLEHVGDPPFVLNVTGPGILRVKDLAAGLAQRLGRSTSFSGTESPTAWLNDASKSHALLGPPQVDIEQMLDWVADWARHGRELLGKPTHFEARDGKY